MKRRRLGCLTTGGLTAMVVALVVIGISYATTGSHMFSPGELNAQASVESIGGVHSHADLEDDCAACHPAFWSPSRMTNLCLDCHQPVIDQLADTSTLHGAVMAGFDMINCRDCHTDHNGPQASLTNYLSPDFKHELVGFALTAHKQIDWEREMVCMDCHEDGFTSFEPLICQTCHEQIDNPAMSAHTNLFGFACLDCHDGVDSYGSDFDHDKAAFPLDGAHELAACVDCHPDARSLVDLQMTPAACESCHKEDDPHQGVMGEQCAVCHNPSAWEDAIFDHSSTGFLLVGGHDNLECGTCHDDASYQGLDPACISCHGGDDPHQRKFGENCALCHVVSSWQQVTFDHSGDYARDCISCHTVDKPANHYSAQCSACHSTNAWKPASFDHSAAGATDCISCHSGNRPNNHFSGQCSQCHSTNAWKPASFKHSFPLNHGGANQQCQLCHTNQNYNAYTCYGCHEHNPSRIQDKHKEVNNFSNNCIRCHPGGREADDD